MTARAFMTMRCDVDRDSATTKDDWGNPVAPSWVGHMEGLACWAWLKSRKVLGDDGKTVLIQDLRMMVPLGTAITEEHRISNIKDRRANVLYAGPYAISSMERHHTHLELTLDQVA